MQFFDRPSRRNISLRGASARPLSSTQLLQQSHRLRAERALRRSQQDAAKKLQAVMRQISGTTHVMPRNSGVISPNQRVVVVLLVARLINAAPTATTQCSRILNAAAEMPHVRAALNALIANKLNAQRLADVDQPRLVRLLVLIFAVCELSLAGSLETQLVSVRDCLQLSLEIATCLSAQSLQEQAKFGVFVRAAAVFRLIRDARDVTLEKLMLKVTQTLFAYVIPALPSVYAHILTTQYAISVLSIPDITTALSLSTNSARVQGIIHAVATDFEAADPFSYDMAHSLSTLDSTATVTTLLNFLDVAQSCWTSSNRVLFSFIGILSTLIQQAPANFTSPSSDDDDDDNDDVVMYGTSTVSRLSTALKRVVTQDKVCSLFTAAVQDGQKSLIRVCQLFNFLLRREKDLRDEFLGALAFWRGSRSAGNVHILNQLWRYCKSALTSSNIQLAEETTPILAIFSSAYAYLLYVQDADELFQNNWPFSENEVRGIVTVLKQQLFSALYFKTMPVSVGSKVSRGRDLLRKEEGLVENVSKLLFRLHACDSQRPFRSNDPDFWHAGVGLLTSDSFLEDAIAAGPGVLTASTDVASDTPVANSSQMAAAGARDLLRLASYLVPFKTRAKIFQNWIAHERDTANSNFVRGPIMGRSVAVQRKSIFQDAFNELNDLGPALKATIRVQFIDEHGMEEAGVDGGGVFKEFMNEALTIGFSPHQYGLFKATPDGRLYPDPDSRVAHDNFREQFTFLGRLLGKAVFDGVLVDIPLAWFFLAKLLGQYNYPIDLGSLDPELYKNIRKLKSLPADEVEHWGLNFTIVNKAYGQTDVVELITNGQNISVTASNRIEYMHRVANYRMNIQLKEQCEAFLKGFSEVVPLQYIRLFSREELQLLISGKPGRIDLEDLMRNTKYSGGYTEETPVVKWFWQAMSELEAEEQGKMLQFVTSSPRAPLLGFSYLVPGFCIHRAEGNVRLPTASTCLNLLKLPRYESLDVVRSKIRYAIESNAGFDLS